MKAWESANVKIRSYGIALLGVLVSAVADAADWRDDMWERPVALREGVTARAYTLDAPRLMKAYVVTVDLTTPGMGLTATERVKGWGDLRARLQREDL